MFVITRKGVTKCLLCFCDTAAYLADMLFPVPCFSDRTLCQYSVQAMHTTTSVTSNLIHFQKELCLSKPSTLSRNSLSRCSLIRGAMTSHEAVVRLDNCEVVGAKRLLARRAAVLGCKVSDIDDSDTWGIDLKLSQCRAQSEPLKEPRTCCLCLR